VAARAKDLPERIVVWRHIMRDSWSPIITLLGLDFGWFLGGVLVTVSNLVVDIAYTWLDPRVKYS